MSKEKDQIIEDLLVVIEGAANFMRGMSLDPQVPATVKSALNHKISQLDAASQKYEEL